MGDEQVTGGCAHAVLARQFAKRALNGAVDLTQCPRVSFSVGPLIRVARVEDWFHQASQFRVGIALDQDTAVRGERVPDLVGPRAAEEQVAGYDNAVER